MWIISASAKPEEWSPVLNCLRQRESKGFDCSVAPKLLPQQSPCHLQELASEALSLTRFQSGSSPPFWDQSSAFVCRLELNPNVVSNSRRLHLQWLYFLSHIWLRKFTTSEKICCLFQLSTEDGPVSQFLCEGKNVTLPNASQQTQMSSLPTFGRFLFLHFVEHLLTLESNQQTSNVF